jgi:hypothetical protein
MKLFNQTILSRVAHLSALCSRTAVRLCGCLLLFAACNPSENDPEAITVTNTAALTQEVYADQTAGTSGVTITTTGAWTSNIATVATQHTTPAQSQSALHTAAAASASAWISISPDHGDTAGNYTIQITLVPNTTGAGRTAVITISCEGTEITITVMQKAEKEDGTTPTPPTQPYGGAGTFTNTMAADQPLVVDGAKYDYRNGIYFYKDNEELSGALYLNISFPGQAAGVPLPAGTYYFVDYGLPEREYGFYCQKGVLGGMMYYGKGGTVTVSINNDIYTIAVDMDTYHDYAGNTTTGKIRGTYTGYLPEE